MKTKTFSVEYSELENRKYAALGNLNEKIKKWVIENKIERYFINLIDKLESTKLSCIVTYKED